MEKFYHTVVITIYDRDACYRKVGEILHDFADHIQLRVGYPISEDNIAVLFLMMKMTNNEMGAFSGTIGQLQSVKVKTSIIKKEKK